MWEELDAERDTDRSYCQRAEGKELTVVETLLLEAPRVLCIFMQPIIEPIAPEGPDEPPGGGGGGR